MTYSGEQAERVIREAKQADLSHQFTEEEIRDKWEEISDQFHDFVIDKVRFKEAKDDFWGMLSPSAQKEYEKIAQEDEGKINMLVFYHGSDETIKKDLNLVFCHDILCSHAFRLIPTIYEGLLEM